MRHNEAITAIALLSAAACSSPADDARSTTLLLGNSRADTDTIEVVLIGIQRDLLSAVSARDTAMLSRLLSGEFRSHDVLVSEVTPMSLDRGNRPEQLTYLEVLAGGLSDRVAPEYSTFHVVPDGSTATVFAFGTGHAIQTTWRYGPRGWQASRMILLRPEAARAMIDLAQK